MKHTNRQFGELEYEDKHVLEFPGGIIGFESFKKFVIVNDEQTEPFRWLISLEDEDLSFPIIEPTVLLPYYKSKLGKAEAASIYVIATLSADSEKSTVNLRSPILVSDETKQGEQIILHDDALSMQHPLIPHSHEREEE